MDDIPYIDKEGRNYKYGEFFPSELSLFTYNKSWGNKFFPLGKEEALRQGFNWEENPIRDYKITIQTKDLPDHIQNISDNILEEIIECEHKNVICNHECTETFKILPNELQFYRQMNLALPRLCPHCRHYERLKFVNPSKLWDRKCMKNGCSNKFKTPISPNRKEIVYCKECYQAEFI